MKITYNFKVSSEGIQALKIIYEHRIKNPKSHTVSKEQILIEFPEEKHKQIQSDLTYFIEKRALRSIMNQEFSITHLGILALNKWGIETIISKGIAQKVLQSFSSDLNKWPLDNSFDNLKKYGTEIEIWYSFRLLKNVGYIETEESSDQTLPISARITALGRDHQEDIALFQDFIPLNEREFQLKVSNQKIFSWVDSLSQIENLEVEFKSTLPEYTDLRRVITGMANGDSGVIFIGMADDGVILGIDNPDQAKRQTNQHLRDFDIDIKFRTIKDENENKVLMIMIPSTQEFNSIGSDIYLRKDGQVQKLKPNEVYLEYKKKQLKSRWGFTFLLSLINFEP